ncbi:MAG TPA: adenylate/guanylate cyclase domain-containing protein [Pseudonocardiaceae bacterium]|nr:adenylate/guanylate cyclase domain-containing protein [Pseudonocardiaceae bacterium]
MTDTFGSRLLGSADQPVPILRIRVQVLLTTLLIVTNVIGAAVVVGLLVVVIPGPRPTVRTLSAMAVAVPAYVLAGLVLGGWWGTRRAMRTLRWALAGQAPTSAERARALRLPRDLTVVQAVSWAGAAVAFAVLVGVTQPGLLWTVPATIAFTGIVVCANAYLLGEFALRPVAARALAEDVRRGRHGGVRSRMLVFWCLGTGVPIAGLIGLGALVLIRGGVTAGRLAITVIVLGLVVFGFGLLVTVFTARAIVNPLQSVRGALERVRQGDLDVAVAVYDGTELGVLQAGLNRMVLGLRERERIRDLFGRHVGHEVASAALARSVELGGEVCEVSVLFVDLVGSTRLAATRAPDEVVELLNRFFAVVVDEIDAHGGLVNKFVGDAVLAVFGAPEPVADHVTRALAAARAIAHRLPAEVPDADAGIGVATGRVVAGNVGDRRRFEYTVIGDPVNQAARLTELAKGTPDRLLAPSAMIDLAERPEAAHWAESDAVTLRGHDRPTTLARPRSPIEPRPPSGLPVDADAVDQRDG